MKSKKLIQMFFYFLSAFIFLVGHQKSFSATTFVVSAVGDKHETISKKSIKVKKGKKATFTIKAKRAIFFQN